jgi:hypothetical protein
MAVQAPSVWRAGASWRSGAAGVEASTWWGILAPARVPAIVDKLCRTRALERRDVQNRIDALGADIVGGGRHSVPSI